MVLTLTEQKLTKTGYNNNNNVIITKRATAKKIAIMKTTITIIIKVNCAQ